MSAIQIFPMYVGYLVLRCVHYSDVLIVFFTFWNSSKCQIIDLLFRKIITLFLALMCNHTLANLTSDLHYMLNNCFSHRQTKCETKYHKTFLESFLNSGWYFLQNKYGERKQYRERMERYSDRDNITLWEREREREILIQTFTKQVLIFKHEFSISLN